MDLRIAPPERLAVPLAPAPEFDVAEPALDGAASVWSRLRTRFALPGCEYSPAVQRWARTYTQGPDRFAASLKRALPFLMLVLDELERQDLPGEFALLPYLESHYEPIAGRSGMPAGMWQFMPDTARAVGLQVSPHYDGRLDAWASSAAAVSMLKRYQNEFGDWRLVNMAFNAGEYRVKKLLQENRSAALSREDVANLKLSPITHEHLAKLLALGCVINDPQRFGVTLPEPAPEDYLVRVTLTAPIDMRVAARLADVPEEALRRYNAGHRQSRISASAPMHLLLPKPALGRFQQRYTQLAPSAWSTWDAVKLRERSGLGQLAGAAAVPIDLVGAANGADPAHEFAAGTTVFLPSALGRNVGTAQPPVPLSPEAQQNRSTTITVKSGDNLWTLAKTHKVSVNNLRRWNKLSDKAQLKPGQKLVLQGAD
ncbi:MAG: transglycosylase SLT domain-containing protein [Rhodanobacteraceae bacterium]|nr:transglycosylase SLT domain-containing protein [Rhodanobacteraceae bacterium]